MSGPKSRVKSHIVIISPAMAKANNGNWQTAHRWAGFLDQHYRVSVAASTGAGLATLAPDLVITLHAQRSAAALCAYRTALPALPIILVLTGTDLYRDIRVDPQAQQALQLATRLVVLQEAGLQELAPELQARTSVIYQSAAPLKPRLLKHRPRHFKVIMIGHLRAEKDPATYMRAAALLDDTAIRLFHVGGVLEPALGELARQTEQALPIYSWLGNLPHAQTRQQLKRCDLMVLTSRIEGGANVIIEAVSSGVAVLASDISGNRGMLGQDYAGYFPVGDSAALARLIERAAQQPDFIQLLKNQGAQRAALFTPAAEQSAVLQLVDNCLTHSLHSQETP